MISRTQRRQTRSEALRRRQTTTKKKRWSFVLTFLLAAVLCGSAALAAPEIDDSPTAEQLAALQTSNSAFAYAYNQHEAFVGDTKTSIGLCGFADKARQEGWNYVYGGKGQRMTPSLLSAIISGNLNDPRSPYLREGYIASTLQQIGNRATDCSGLVMNYMWWAGDATDPIHALCPSIGNYNANAMLEAAVEKGNIATMPEIPGLLVHSNGHVGIYVGNGEVIEARGVKYGVVKTQLAERSWKYWSKSPWIDYDLSGIYDLYGRFVFLDGGEDIGQERWVAKFVYGDQSAGSKYTPVCDPDATFHSALPAVLDADQSVGAPELPLVDRILAAIDAIPYDSRYGYQFEGHWYVILVDEQGMPEAILNDPAEADGDADTSSQEEQRADSPDEHVSQDAEQSSLPETTQGSGSYVFSGDVCDDNNSATVFVAPNPVPEMTQEPAADAMETHEEEESDPVEEQDAEDAA